jgi:hypothetical protein
MGARRMISINPTQAIKDNPLAAMPIKFRRATQSEAPSVLTDIYEEDSNISIWQRELSAELKAAVKDFLASNQKFQTSMTVTPESGLSSVRQALGAQSSPLLSENIAELVDMFCFLFGLKRAGLRLSILDRAMCPKFHVDKVPCRLITTYEGIATEWLHHQDVNREKLGAGSKGLADDQSGLFENSDDIQQLNCGDVALLKGERWEGNENAGLVHRSPVLLSGERRLILTLDFSS